MPKGSFGISTTGTGRQLVPEAAGDNRNEGETGLQHYVGRFAPSPTGPLHFGSLVAAAASYLDARANNGSWLVRVENIDPPREAPGAVTAILRALETYGFEWQGPVTYQGSNEGRHRAVIADLIARGLAYPCTCSRSSLADAPAGESGPVYPGTCRRGCDAGEHAIRLLTNDLPVSFTDGLQGRFEQRLESAVGDFIIRRRDGLIAYQLAVVVDDFDQGITDVVRGLDLMDSTPRQLHLQRCLDMPQPRYKHTPLVLSADGQKLSKSSGAKPIPLDRVEPVLIRALASLWQEPAPELAEASLEDVWKWAIENWDPEKLRAKKQTFQAPETIANKQNRLS